MTVIDTRIYVGSDVVLDWTIVPDSGNTVASEITLEIHKPDDSIATFTSVSSGWTTVAVNHYRVTYKTTLAGLHRWFWKSEGTVNHTKAGVFNVGQKGF